MDTLFAGVLSGMISWLGNSALIKWLGEKRAVVWLVPVLEEGAKTGLAIFLGGSIFYTHVIFGTLEGILDIRNGVNGFKAAVYSVLTHSVFGFLASMVFHAGFGLWGAIIVGIVAHMLWNWHIVKD